MVSCAVSIPSSIHFCLVPVGGAVYLLYDYKPKYDMYIYIFILSFISHFHPGRKGAVGLVSTVVSLLTFVILSISSSTYLLILFYLFCLFVYLSLFLSFLPCPRAPSGMVCGWCARRACGPIPETFCILTFGTRRPRNPSVMFPFLAFVHPCTNFLYCPVSCCPAIFVRTRFRSKAILNAW